MCPATIPSAGSHPSSSAVRSRRSASSHTLARPPPAPRRRRSGLHRAGRRRRRRSPPAARAGRSRGAPPSARGRSPPPPAPAPPRGPAGRRRRRPPPPHTPRPRPAARTAPPPGSPGCAPGAGRPRCWGRTCPPSMALTACRVRPAWSARPCCDSPAACRRARTSLSTGPVATRRPMASSPSGRYPTGPASVSDSPHTITFSCQTEADSRRNQSSRPVAITKGSQNVRYCCEDKWSGRSGRASLSDRRRRGARQSAPVRVIQGASAGVRGLRGLRGVRGLRGPLRGWLPPPAVPPVDHTAAQAPPLLLAQPAQGDQHQLLLGVQRGAHLHELQRALGEGGAEAAGEVLMRRLLGLRWRPSLRSLRHGAPRKYAAETSDGHRTPVRFPGVRRSIRP